MTSVEGLRARLQKAREERQQQQNDDTFGNNTTDRLTDLTGWQGRIQEQGNLPKDWMELITFVSKNLAFPDEDSRQRHLSCFYDRGLNKMDAGTCKYDEAYAQFLISHAQFKSLSCKDDGREAFNLARVTVKTHAIVHIAAAQFELSQGNKGKCKKILEKAKGQAKPDELLNKAFRNFLDGRKTLLSESDSTSSSQNENEADIAFRKKSVDSDSGQSSQDSSSEIHYSSKNLRGNRQVLKEIVPCTPKESHRPGEISFNSHLWDDGTVSFKVPPAKNMNRNRLVSQDSDDADTAPISFETGRGSYNRGSLSATKPALRSYHSTPDCKNQGPTSTCSTSKRKFVGRPLRVARTSLTKLMEDDPNEDDEYSIKKLECSPPQDSGNTDCTIQSMMTTMKSTTISPVAEDSGIADLQSSLHPIPEVSMESTHFLPRPKRQNVCTEESKPNNCMTTASKQHTPDTGVVLTEKKTLFASPLPVFSQTPRVKRDIAESKPVSKATPVSEPVKKLNVEKPQETVREIKQEIVTKPVPQEQPAVQAAVPAPVPVLPGVMNESMLTVKGRSYLILSTIGRGGSSKVYKALDMEKKNTLAIKHVNLEGVGESTLTGYLNEITLLKRLQYSNRVIKLYDCEYNASKQALYVIMEAGDTDLANLFRSRVKQHSELKPTMIQFYWMEMLEAVQVLHKEGIIHSDLKPANFILVAGNLKLIDFGIANAIQDDQTSVYRDTQVGTLNFMSPESILGHNMEAPGSSRPQFKVGVKSDVWSLGCILYNMVYGKTPFQHITNQIAKLQAIINPQCKINFPELDNSQLVNTLQRCLDRDPKRRPDIDELLQIPWLK